MRHIIAVGSFTVLGFIALSGFWLARKSKAALEPGVLFPQVSALVVGWDSQNVPESGRMVNIIVGDSEISSLVNKLSDSKNSGLQSVLDAETLPAANQSGFKRFGGWFKRTFLRKTMSSGVNGALAKAFPNSPNTITWTHKGFETASEEEMVRELMKAIIKANDAGAEVNIVTQGIAALPALKAIKRLEGLVRKNRPVSVNKLLALDMNKPTLMKLDPSFFQKFKRPANLNEYANVWRSPSPPNERKIELFTRNHNGVWLQADKLLPTLGLNKAPPDVSKPVAVDADLAKFAGILLNRVNTLEKVVDYMVKTAKGKAEAERLITATARNLEGAAFQKQIHANVASEPVDSLSAINADWLKGEIAKADKNGVRSEQTWKGGGGDETSSGQSGGASNCNKGHCSWYDARAYCGGRLPTVAQLESMYQAECTGDKLSDTCGKGYWSSEAEGPYSAWFVMFRYNYHKDSHKYTELKTSADRYVRCSR